MTASDTLDLLVADRLDDRGDIVRLDLVAPDGGDLPAFEAGAHVELEVADAAGTVFHRSYSLWGDPADHRRWRLGVLLDPASRGGSKAVHAVARPGATLKASAPRNHFPLAVDAAPSVLIGGGIGITPMLAMAQALHAAGRPFELHYCTRSAERTAFLDLLPTFPFADRIHLHHDDGGAEGPFVPATGLPAASAGAHLYVCGPTGFMDWILGAAAAAGWDEAHLHREYFSAEVDVSGAAFEVEARRSGVTVRVEEGVSIAAALAEAGVTVPLSCEEGVCGTCLCDVLEGTPDHRDHFLTDDEKAGGELILVCCSRAKSAKLVLDV